MRVLAGDIGGTHARLAVVDIGDDHVRVERERQFASRDFPGLAPIVREFLDSGDDRVERAAFGIAGPVIDGEVVTPNLPWTVSESRLAQDIGIAHAAVLNDLDAIARGTARLDARDLVTLQAGAPQERGVRALIGAGTGLGFAFVIWDRGGYRTHPSEGGHASFGPAGPRERDLLAELADEFGHVSRERVLSGPGLVRIYRFVAARPGATGNPAVRADVDRDGGAAVSRHGLDGSDASCAEALDIFARAYGAAAGDLALTVLATGGVYVVGGIAPAIVRKLVDGTFMTAFREKGRLSEMMARFPVHIVMNGNVGLFGAALAAYGAETRATPSTGAAPTTQETAGAR